MGKLKVLQSSLNGGEISPRAKGRPELARYQSGMELCENFIPTVLGGAISRPGTRKVAVAIAGGANQLDSYTALDDDGTYRGFCLESVAGTTRAFKGYQVAAEIETTLGFNFATRQLAQFEDYLYMTRPDALPLRLKRIADANWIMEEVPFTAIPFERPADTEDITLAPSGTSGNITLTASAPFFKPGHVGVKFQVNGGRVEVTAVTSETQASATVTVNISVPIGVRSAAKTFIVNFNPDDLTPGVPVIFNCVAQADYTTRQMSSVTNAVPGGVNVSVVDTVNALTGTEPDKAWTEQAWSELRGFPTAVDFFEQRMLLAGSKTYPTTVWGSKSGNLIDFTLGTNDDDAFSFTLAAADTPIRSIKAEERIYVFTATRELTIESGNDKPITPTNFRIKPRSKQGASKMPAVKTGSDLIFSSVSRNKLNSLVYRFDVDRFVCNDLTIFGEHLIKEGGGIEQVVVLREPIPMLACRTASGRIITLTLDTQQQVEAWARITTDGVVKDIAAVPDATGNEQIWQVVERNGNTLIEAFDWSLQTDSAVTGTDEAGKTIWDGLEHLEGKTVVAVADGFVVQGLTVEDGSVTLPFPAKVVEVGLPFTATIKDLPPVVAGVTTTISGQSSVNSIQVLLHDTKGCMVNGERIPFQCLDGNLLDNPVPAFSGWKKVGGLGWGNSGSGGQVTIVRDLPLPCTVLAINKEVTVNG